MKICSFFTPDLFVMHHVFIINLSKMLLNLCTHPCFSLFYENVPIYFIKLSTT